jgi:hypothetical protein
MTFRLLEQIKVPDGTTIRTISLYEGDLSRIPPEQTVDLLVVSSFPDNYRPTPGTVIGALDGVGISVDALARDKLHDLRSMTAFWLSRPLDRREAFNIGQIACFEPAAMGAPPEVVGALFRGLFPFVDSRVSTSVAMPLLASGNQGWPDVTMLEALLDAAFHWLERGLSISDLKIVLLPGSRTEVLAEAMRRFKQRVVQPPRRQNKRSYDVFLSYASADKDGAEAIHAGLRQMPSPPSVFDYRMSISVGSSWQQAIDEAIESCATVIALLSPAYFNSKVCQEEIALARLRHRDSSVEVLRPIYWKDWGRNLDLWLRAMNYVDCREADAGKLSDIARAMALQN